MKPVLFEIPWLGLPVFSYGFMLMLGFMTGTLLALRHARREKINEDHIMDIILFCVFAGGLVGARLFFFFEYWRELETFWSIFEFWKGGLTFYGGFLLATGASLGYMRWKKMSVSKVADIFAVSTALGLVFGRIGCFLNGCCFGKETDAAWGVCYPSIVHGPGGFHNSSVWEHQHSMGLHPPVDWSLPVHPTQIYSSIYNLLIFVFLLWFYNRKKYDGQVALVFAAAYSVARFCVEYFRADNDVYMGLFTISQIVSLVVFPVVLGLLIYNRNKTSAQAPVAGDIAADSKK